MSEPSYLDVNRANWDERARVHAASPGYSFADFVADPGYLSEVVRFDRPRLGDIDGLRGIHLQCHIGTDTVSLARLGARMTGLDLSPASLDEARRLAEATDTPLDLVEAEVYAAPEHFEAGAFDLVYTGIGAICWLPSVRRWAEVVAHLLAPGGRLFIREGHPVLWSLEEERPDDLLVIRYPYFEHDEPLVFEEETTYVETDHVIENSTTHSWNHGIGEILTAVIDAGLVLTAFEEHDSVPWEALPGQMALLDDPPGEWRITNRPERVPHTYTLQAVKPG